MSGRADLEEAARLDWLGLDGDEFLQGDTVRRVSLLARAKHLAEYRRIDQVNLSREIAAALVGG